MRRGIPAAAFVVLAASVAGCGSARTPVPRLTVPVASGSRVSFPAVGISFRAPARWVRVSYTRPLYDVLTSGSAVIALWRYRQKAVPPGGVGGLDSARTRLISAARSRDPTLQLIRTKLTRIDGAATIVLDAIESISGHLRRSRAFHVFVRGGEIVVDEYAPVTRFHAIDHRVFSPLNHSLQLLRSRA